MRMVSGGHPRHGGEVIGFGGTKDCLFALVFASHFSSFSCIFGPIEVRLLMRSASACERGSCLCKEAAACESCACL